VSTESPKPMYDPAVLVERMKSVGWVLDSMTPRHARMRWPIETEILINGRGLMLHVPVNPEDIDYNADLDYLLETFAAIQRASEMVTELESWASNELGSDSGS
jgi:hypothetical protein